MSLQKRLDREAAGVARIVRLYCDETTSDELRAAFRKETNRRSAPYKIVVDCEGK